MNREEREGRENPGREGSGRQEVPEIDCATARRELMLLVDCECDDACRRRLEKHIDGCRSCRETFGIEQRLKAVLSRSCCGRAPSELREKLRVQIRSTVVSTQADGSTVVRRSSYERRDFGR